jgi:putative CocE/NonD family hydrolase
MRTAAEKPPHLTCIVPVVARYGISYEYMYHGGILKLSHARTLDDVGFSGSLGQYRKHPVDGFWWNYVEKQTMKGIEKIDVPVFMIGGWYDLNTELVITTFGSLRWSGKVKDGKAEAIEDKRVKILIGPWEHCDAAAGKSRVGDLNFPEAKAVSEKEAHRFFDYWLRDMKDNGWGNESAIRLFQMGENRWYGVDKWPNWPLGEKTGADEKVYYLRAGGALSEEPENSAEVRPDTYKFDPADPSPTIGGLNLYCYWKRGVEKVESGPKDQRVKVEKRNDCVIYTTGKLDEDVAVRGTVTVPLFISSDRKDTDFMVRLCDVYPDNRSIIITDGAQRARFRNWNLPRREIFMEPGEKYEVKVRLSVTAHTFLKGHRIRIIVSSSNCPRFDVNPNDGGHFLEKGKKGLVATNSIYHDSEYRSSLILPLAEKTTDEKKPQEEKQPAKQRE